MDNSLNAVSTVFIMEQHLGHATFYQNLRHFVDTQGWQSRSKSRWVEVTYKQSGELWKMVHGTLIGGVQVWRGLSSPYDIAFFNTQVPAVLAGRARYRRPYVLSTDITPRQYDLMGAYYHHTPDRKGLISAYKQHVNREVFQGAARILAWSSWVAKSLINDYDVPPERVEVVSPGIDLDLWQLNGQHRQLRAAPMRILFVGGDFYRKGGDLLLKAFASLPPGTAELSLVTRTPINPQPGVTIYADLQPNDPALRALYQSADVFVLPTRAEAFGIAAAEASAMELPVVATRIGGLSDIVCHGQTGLLIPPNDTNALAEALTWLVQHPEERQQMGRAARVHAETHFDACKNAARIVTLLEEIVTSSRP